ncbi:CLUMA_CG019279, isoform A [Clunio marinus]|uniref:CLUMA_CG019279, isoform A n=1 Tax=Clunio marinus TaxID=568069 RepID=A0A1J1J3P7_9DIPT|nr:CLUMA_CG019279, isoform A [Clunio marinus]
MSLNSNHCEKKLSEQFYVKLLKQKLTLTNRKSGNQMTYKMGRLFSQGFWNEIHISNSNLA